eukprot:TRINITY_DN10952_c1_g2_i1.p2 TRINITY_DN10952_c1_g2~~TRINITY_DN10952_c1_g2_i1.p2  ORF type:complete len:235 (-),score=40.22 TRINITY_DN10952_c1_g2_i1:187-891(-)
MSNQDPFVRIKDEISREMSSIEGSYLQLKGLQVENPKRKKIGQALKKGCDDVIYQIGEVEKALDRAEKDPARYGLSPEEINQRRKWATQCSNKAQSYIEALQEDQKQINNLKNNNHNGNHSKNQNQNELEMQNQEQESLLRQQDEQLDSLSEQVGRIGEIGIRIHEELNTQNNMLDELDTDVEITTNRIKVAQVKIGEVIKKSGTFKQLVCVIILVVILIILIALAASPVKNKR